MKREVEGNNGNTYKARSGKKEKEIERRECVREIEYRERERCPNPAGLPSTQYNLTFPGLE